MTGTALIRLPTAVAWELRRCWAAGSRVSLSIDGDVRRVEGHVTHVSATGSHAVVGGVHVPLERVLAVHRPSRLGDSTFNERERWAGEIPEATKCDPRQLSFDFKE